MDRTNRIACEMQKALTEIISREMNDPRIPVITSVTKVKLTKDLQFAKAYVSMVAKDEEKNKAIECLNSSTGFIRSCLGKKMIIRQLPQLVFETDNSVEEGVHMAAVIDRVIKAEKEGKKDNEA